ncbi:MAG: hypothetical protein Sylvanvirus38_2 [Sylvanvirus sp.]|uniref:Uncharacterized protein n=1 Tax=Sylvanvirus sp. TaxID=2487774 RepID=A0A3G5ALL0_9VIRU|nr:MAG: hypothetical protein Sylvanvirus38_2 [Sylvanvirus sp.]
MSVFSHNFPQRQAMLTKAREAIIQEKINNGEMKMETKQHPVTNIFYSIPVPVEGKYTPINSKDIVAQLSTMRTQHGKSHVAASSISDSILSNSVSNIPSIVALSIPLPLDLRPVSESPDPISFINQPDISQHNNNIQEKKEKNISMDDDNSEEDSDEESSDYSSYSSEESSDDSSEDEKKEKQMYWAYEKQIDEFESSSSEEIDSDSESDDEEDKKEK